MSENILFGDFEYRHEVLDESSNRGPLFGCEAWTDYLDSYSVVVESDDVSPVGLSCMPGDLFWICQLVGIPVGVDESMCGYWIGRLVLCPVGVDTCEDLDVALECSWRSGCVVDYDVVAGVLHSFGCVPLGLREVFFPWKHTRNI